MSKLDDIIAEHTQLAIDALYDVEWEFEQVDCDDYGDPEWKWHAKAYLDGEPVTDDWFRNKPDNTRLYNYLLEGVKDGFIGDRIADILTQDDNYDKAERSLKNEQRGEIRESIKMQ